MVAVPPGKGNGREHQDLRRRHLLVREIVNDPRPSNIAALRPLEELSADDGRFHQSIRRFFDGDSFRQRLARFSEPEQDVARPSVTDGSGDSAVATGLESWLF